ncbi:hypothetical protein [Nocardiopsis dassonvillei]|uniref:hypothetical protein n=1 Tax=Nocardiopsis dassonvillei TaxID=2014 RepID=UPI003F56A4EB
MANEKNWDQISLSGDPHLILGRKKGSKGMEAREVPIESQLFEPLRRLAEESIERLLVSTPREYDPNASLEEKSEYFQISKSDIPEKKSVARKPKRPIDPAQKNETEEDLDKIRVIEAPSISESVMSARLRLVKADEYASEQVSADLIHREKTNPDRTAALIQSLSDVEIIDYIEPEKVHSFQAIFYSIAFQQEDKSWVHFIKKMSPTGVFKPGRLWGRFRGDLKRIETPDILLYEDIDVVLGRNLIAGFRPFPLQVLFTDVGLMMKSVPDYVSEISNILASTIPLTPDAQAALAAHGARTVSSASRIYRLIERMSDIELNQGLLSLVLERHKIDPSTIISPTGKFDFDEQEVSTFLDILESRYYSDDWTGELRRADKYSRRS